jgi:hypothetical protein
LGYCSLHQADLSVMAFIEDAMKFSAQSSGEQPKECWVGHLGGSASLSG